MTDSMDYTDLGRELAAIREEAQRRIQLVEGRRLEQVRNGTKWRRLSTDELVARVESHAEAMEWADEVGARIRGGLGRWAA